MSSCAEIILLVPAPWDGQQSVCCSNLVVNGVHLDLSLGHVVVISKNQNQLFLKSPGYTLYEFMNKVNPKLDYNNKLTSRH